MNKNKSAKKLEYKKSLVRNPEYAKPKTVVIQQPEISNPSPVFQKTASEEYVLGEDKAAASRKTKFESPELNSALRIARKIESVENVKPRKVKSISDLDKKKSTTLYEKAAKQVNFPYNQAIYKDLIPLCVKTQPQQQLPSISREIVAQKEKEPVLNDFFTPKVLPEYSFQVPVQTAHKTLNRQFDGFKLYRTIKNWN